MGVGGGEFVGGVQPDVMVACASVCHHLKRVVRWSQEEIESSTSDIEGDFGVEVVESEVNGEEDGPVLGEGGGVRGRGAVHLGDGV